MATSTSTPTSLSASVITTTSPTDEVSRSVHVPRAVDDFDDGFEESHLPDASAFNYYFLLLAVLVVLVALLLWFIHRCKTRQRERLRRGGEQALARDLDGWTDTRRLLHGRYRHNDAVFVHNDEGLDDHGEAPPPYQPKTAATTADVTIPLRALPRDEIERSRPPQYCDTPRSPLNISAAQDSVHP
ncbi:hypothetical protein BDW02DRAFT_571522 [Decorospora gaudefroyi]|uniref:Uncharacterized protein n=1 Tax=Decorospora gaudefroyi TaxID=184978 RepID=A0A6A5K5R5_9PLEO|nr:hypothetical protein BDW02DRAFT_571522 [Decorospora gaudefroyi]